MGLSPALDLILRGMSPGARAARYGVQALWNLNEASGQRSDAYGANHLTDNNTVTNGTAKVGALAAQFTAATSEYLSIADNAALSTGDVDFWIAAWVYLDSVGADRYAIAKATGVEREHALFYQTSSTQMRFGISSNGTGFTAAVGAATFGTPATATWYFVMAYHDSVNDLIKISVNGGAFDSAAAAAGPADRASAFEIGRNANAGTNYWDGRIDAVAFGKSPPAGIAALATEIRDYLWAGGAGREYPGGWT